MAVRVPSVTLRSALRARQAERRQARRACPRMAPVVSSVPLPVFATPRPPPRALSESLGPPDCGPPDCGPPDSWSPGPPPFPLARLPCARLLRPPAMHAGPARRSVAHAADPAPHTLEPAGQGAVPRRTHGGSTHVGSTHVGSTHVGSTDVGSTHVGSTHIGSTHVGSAHVGSSHLGSTHVVSMHVAAHM